MRLIYTVASEMQFILQTGKIGMLCDCMYLISREGCELSQHVSLNKRNRIWYKIVYVFYTDHAKTMNYNLKTQKFTASME